MVAAEPAATQLTAWFDLNKAWFDLQDGTDPPPAYPELPASYIYSKGVWRKKKQRVGVTIGRMHWVHPATGGEKFYLRMLLGRKTFCRRKDYRWLAVSRFVCVRPPIKWAAKVSK